MRLLSMDGLEKNLKWVCLYGLIKLATIVAWLLVMATQVKGE